MFDSIVENKEWLFSGVGISALALIIAAVVFIYKFIVGRKEKLEGSAITDNDYFDCYRYVPDYFLRRSFSEHKVISHVKMDVRSRGDSVNLRLGQLPTCEVWLQVINHTPFPLDVETIKGVLNYNGCSINIENKHHIDIDRHSTIDSVLLEGDLTGEQAEHCSIDKDKTYTSLTLHSRIRTKFALFKKDTGDISYLHVAIMNRRRVAEID